MLRSIRPKRARYRYPPIRHRNKCHVYLNDLATADVAEDLPSRWSEPLSSQRLQQGGGMVNLSAAEWLDRWRVYRH
jgi:hypothetical protein